MDEIETVYAPERVRPSYSRTGWALFAILGITTVLQLAGAAVAYQLAPQLYSTSWFTWVMTFAPLYIIAIPVGYLIIRPAPKMIVPQEKLSIGKLFAFVAMSFAIMYIGNIIGTLLNAGISALRGTATTNPLTMMMTGANVYAEILVVCICAPVVEELVFRKLLLDRIREYGEGTAILISGLTFGLFHGNLFQFFYAFGLGALFAYVYLRTGRLRYPIILHVIINTYGTIQSRLLTNPDTGVMNTQNTQDLISQIQGNLPHFIGVALCSLIGIALFITGIVLLIKNRKKAVLFPAPKELPKGGRFKAIFINWGMGLYTLLALGLIVYMVFGV